MTFLDMQHFRRGGSYTPSSDGRWMLYTVSTPDWEEAERQSDIHLVSLEQGVSSSRQMTFTDDKNETSPAWSRDGGFFVFLSAFRSIIWNAINKNRDNILGCMKLAKMLNFIINKLAFSSMG